MRIMPNSRTNTDAMDGNNLFSRYLAFWPLFVAMILICVAGAWLFIRYSIPVYESSATLLIKDENKGLDDSKILSSLNLFASKKIVENEIEVLRSRAVMKEVVKKLSLYAPVYKEGGINTVSAYAVSPVKIELKNPDTLQEHSNIYFEYDPGKRQVIIDKQAYPLQVWVSTPWGILRFQPNARYRMNSEKSSMFFSLVDTRKVVKGLLAGLEVAPTSKLATVINIKIKDAVPERGEDILNMLIKVYNAAAIQDKNTLAANALSFVQERLHYVVSELDSVESSLQHFKASKGVVDISEQGKLFLESVESNDQKISEINVQLAVLDQIEQYILNKDKSPGMVPSTLGLNDGVLPQLLEKLYDTEIQYERLKRTTAENNPIVVSLQNQIEKIKPSILENVRNQRNNLEAGKSNLSETSDKYASMLRAIPQKERELLEITRQQSIKNGIYTFLLQKREEAALSFASAVADSRLVDSAESGIDPVSPKKSMIYAVAILLGIGSATGFVFTRELLNKNISAVSEVKEMVSLPVIGEISYAGSKKQIVISDGDRSYVAEQFRQLRTSLAYIGINTTRKKILITSSIPSEGKTFVATNLAISLALADKRVVLVELDMRRPRLSQLFGETNKKGIADYLKGRVAVEQIIEKTHIDENLYLIPCGTIPSNPSELIMNGRLEELLKYLDKSFDYIILETAPISAVTDAYIVSRFCDAVLHIVRQGYTPKSFIRTLEDNSKMKGMKNVAIVYNGAKDNVMKNNSYKYSVGYTDNGTKTKKPDKLFNRL